jgi:hypothetical protein
MYILYICQGKSGEWNLFKIPLTQSARTLARESKNIFGLGSTARSRHRFVNFRIVRKPDWYDKKVATAMEFAITA